MSAWILSPGAKVTGDFEVVVTGEGQRIRLGDGGHLGFHWGSEAELRRLAAAATKAADNEAARAKERVA